MHTARLEREFIRPVVRGADTIAFGVGKLPLDGIHGEASRFIEDRARGGAESVSDQGALVAEDCVRLVDGGLADVRHPRSEKGGRCVQ